jgi:acyl dehydratase
MRIFNSLSELPPLVGQELVVSDWITVTQQQINLFAEATGDHQWIHVDEERAKAGPFGGTIAHGYLTLSLIPKMLESAMDVRNVRMSVNYGLNRVRFPSPVPANSRLRARVTLLECEPLPDNGLQIVWQITVEREGSSKPACVAEAVTRRYG